LVGGKKQKEPPKGRPFQSEVASVSPVSGVAA